MYAYIASGARARSFIRSPTRFSVLFLSRYISSKAYNCANRCYNTVFSLLLLLSLSHLWAALSKEEQEEEEKKWDTQKCSCGKPTQIHSHTAKDEEELPNTNWRENIERKKKFD